MKFPNLVRGGAAMTLLLAITSSVLGHGISFNVIVDSGNNLAFSNGMDVGGLKVFADKSQLISPTTGTTTVPGWGLNSALHSSTLRLNVLSNLLYWTAAEGLAASTSDNLTVSRLYFPLSPTPMPDSAVVGQTSIPDSTTILWDASVPTTEHHILEYSVPSGSPPGAYGVLLEIEDTGSVYGTSAPFLLVLNKGLTNTPSATGSSQPLDESQFGQAVLAMTNQLNAEAVPEPATLALMGLAGLVAIPFLQRLRRGRNRA